MFPLPAVYGRDIHAWALQQAALLRAGLVMDIDAQNLAEEIDGVAAAECHRLVSALRVLMVHMLKWDHQPERRSRSRALTITEQRDRVDRFLRQSPSLEAKLDEVLADAYREARSSAARETNLPPSVFPAGRPYDWMAITEQAFPWDP